MSEAIVVSSHVPMPYAPGEHRILVSGPAGQIDVALSVPSGTASGIAIVCHPHPLMGGTMDNKVVTTLSRSCRDAGMVTIRFNFRGVAASAGSFDHGVGEQHDVLALAIWAQTQFALPWLLLAGFSFGAYVSAQVLVTLTADAPTTDPVTRDVPVPVPSLLLVAPPVTRFALSAQNLPAGTRVIYGDADEVVDPQAIAGWLAAASSDVQITVVPTAGHFFHGQLGVLKAWVQRACREINDAN